MRGGAEWGETANGYGFWDMNNILNLDHGDDCITL